MRSDMAKVIVERPRLLGGDRGEKSYKKRTNREGWEGTRKRAGIKARCSGGTKSFNEHLGPLRRYLEANVGRPWNKVYSEICANIDRGNVVQKHILTHVFQYVAIQVVLIDGVPCQGDGTLGGYGQPLRPGRWAARFYVCPLRGLLRRVPRPKGARHPQSYPLVRVDDFHGCRFVDGGWHLLTIWPFPSGLAWEAASIRCFDAMLNRTIGREEAVEHYGRAVYTIAFRRLNKREMKQLPIPIDWQK